jgi:hypothetical protein
MTVIANGRARTAGARLKDSPIRSSWPAANATVGTDARLYLYRLTSLYIECGPKSKGIATVNELPR